MNKIRELIGECEMRRDALDHLIAGLQRVEELFGLPMPASGLADAILRAPRGLPPAIQPRRKTKRAKRAAKVTKPAAKPAARELSPPPTKPVPPVPGDPGPRVIEVMRTTGTPMRLDEIARLTKLPTEVVGRRLAALKDAQRVQVTGWARGARWSLVKSPASTAAAKGPEMEVVFNGGKDQSLSSYAQRLRG